MPLSLGLVQVQVNLSPLPQIMVEHDVSVLTWALQRDLDFAHPHEISPLFRVASSLYLYPSQIAFVSTTETSIFYNTVKPVLSGHSKRRPNNGF